MAALGDSITAGTGALSKNIFKIGEEQRGVSFSAGNVTEYCLERFLAAGPWPRQL